MIVRWNTVARLSLLVVATGAQAGDEKAGIDFFESRIRPVLVEHCYECHSSEAKHVRGGLLLDSREGARTGGDSGPAVVPGRPEESLLLEALRYESFEMPPQGRLPGNVIEDFQTWIETGAADPRDAPQATGAAGPTGPPDVESGRSFWSFQPIRRERAPQTEGDLWSETQIDRFLLARMSATGLTPAADADRRTLIRRAWFDLIGLPPAPERIEAFLRDDSPTRIAFAKVVDELLESPQFGARWGRHWLDVARYADSTGGGRSLLYESSWRYRDYVIDAFNVDKPFDQFIVEQIAGDLLPHADYLQRGEQLTATAFLALGPTNYELQDKEQLRMDVIDEQIDTVGRAFLGMTLGCARCHDHKFDPVPTTDYYALAGIFRSTKTLIHANVSNWVTQELPLEPASQQRVDEHRTQVAALQAEITARSKQVEELELQRPVVTLDDAKATVLAGKWNTSNGVQKFVGEGYRYASGPGNALEYRLPVNHPGTYDVRVSFSAHGNRSPDALFVVSHRAGDSEIRIDQRTKPPIEGLYASLGEYALDSEAVVTLRTDGVSGIVIADAVQIVPLALEEQAAGEAGPAERPDFAAIEQQIAELNAELAVLTTQKKELEKSAPPKPPETVVVTDEAAAEVGDYRVCIRGNPRNLGEVVPRGFLTVASQGPAPPIPAESSGRLELARWIADRDNPLTARVAVNRVWSHLFGVGLVRTVDNFGSTGEAPSHPELLDHLAVQFVEGGWSTKQLIRAIVLSRAYRLSSERSAESKRVDPENRLLSHQNRRRLDAEALYDSILALSGRLDPTLGGDTVREGTKSEYGYEFDVGRRAVYLPVFRNRLPDLFTVFDFPDPNLSIGRRTVSTLSTQALLMMNSPFVMEQARMAAARLLAEPGIDDAQRLDLLYNRALGRPPSTSERQLATAFLQTARIDDASGQARWASLVQAVMASLDFRYIE